MTDDARPAFPLGDLRLRRERRAPLRPADLVRTAPYAADQPLPLVVTPAAGTVDLLEWGVAERDRLRELRLAHGALLLRGFQVRSAEHFSDFVRQVFDSPLEYRERSSPRRQVGAHVYTSTDYPASEEIFLHNENSYAAVWPMVVAFCCLQPAESGGETPLADVRRVYERISAPLRERLRGRGCMYVRNFGRGLGLDWRTVFATEEREAVEAYCAAHDIGCEWLPGDRLRTRHVRPFVATHPATGEALWFNHAVFFHSTSLPRAVREAMASVMAADELPNNTFYEDGTPFEAEVVDELRAAYQASTFQFPWQREDVLVLDNMYVAHSRRPFTGERRVLVGMAEPCDAAAAAAR